MEWMLLGEVTNYEQPTKYLVTTKNYSEKFETPVLTAGKTFILGYTDEDEGIYEASMHPVVIFDDFTTANKWVDFDFKVKSSAMKMIKSKNDNKFFLKYIYYWLSKMPSGLIEGDHKRQWISNFCGKQIPIPCPNNPQKSLAIQTEIARILDSFTALTTELTTELSLRQKQYQYYRDLLLDFDDGEVEWVPLSKLVFVIAAPVKLKKEMYQNSGEIPIIDQGAKFIAGYTNEEIEPVSDNEYIIFGDHSEHIKYVDFAFVQGADGLKILKPISNNTKYIYHAFTNFYQKELNYKRHWSKAKETPIPIPCPNNPQKSLAIQTEIARILDAFTELTIELTTELSLRQKQYQYYRDLLLSFD